MTGFPGRARAAAPWTGPAAASRRQQHPRCWRPGDGFFQDVQERRPRGLDVRQQAIGGSTSAALACPVMGQEGLPPCAAPSSGMVRTAPRTAAATEAAKAAAATAGFPDSHRDDGCAAGAVHVQHTHT